MNASSIWAALRSFGEASGGGDVDDEVVFEGSVGLEGGEEECRAVRMSRR